METAGSVIHENMKTVVDYQTHHRDYLYTDVK